MWTRHNAVRRLCGAGSGTARWPALCLLVTACASEPLPPGAGGEPSIELGGEPRTEGPAFNPGPDAESPGIADASTQVTPAEAGLLPGRSSMVQLVSCEEYELLTDELEPDVLLVVDRSGSMQVGWRSVRSALVKLTRDYEDRVRFGLAVFPAVDGCAAGEVLVAPALDSARDIEHALDDVEPAGLTPTDSALSAAQRYFAAQPSLLPYVVLVTDGAPTCAGGDVADADAEAARAALSAMRSLAEAGVRSYVLGIQTFDAAELLDDLAVAGGTGDTGYRPLDEHSELGEAVAEITQEALSCNFVLNAPAADPSFVTVELDGQRLQYGAADGFRLSTDGRTVFVVGSACAALQEGSHEFSIEILCEM